MTCFLWAPVFDGELVDSRLVPSHQSRVDAVRVGFVRTETEPGGAVYGVRQTETNSCARPNAVPAAAGKEIDAQP